MNTVASWILTITVLVYDANGWIDTVTTSAVDKPFETETACKVGANRYRNDLRAAHHKGLNVSVSTSCLNTDDPATAK